MDMAILLHDGLSRPPDGRSAMSSLKILPDAGDSVASQAVFYALSFFWLDGFAVPAPAQVTQTVRRFISTMHERVFICDLVNVKA